MATVVLIGTLDTKGTEYGYLKRQIRALGRDVVTIDVGILGAPGEADISREDVIRSAGGEPGALDGLDRSDAIARMATGAAAVTAQLHAEGRLHGVLALGGSNGSLLATTAMRALPVGVPKLMVSTVASGDTRSYVGGSDIAMLHSVVDIAGVNRVSERILGNAAAAIAGMALAYERRAQTENDVSERLPLAASMFGVTTACVTEARGWLEGRGHEVLVFHANGAGGRSLEELVRSGLVGGVLEVTTTELADEVVGGDLSAGPDRFEAAGRAGIPQVISLGALDMVNFGPMELVPERFRDRRFYAHNAAVTLMRTTPEECAEIGRRLVKKMNAARGPVALFIPKRGISAIAVEGGPFHDPDADRALIAAVTTGLRAEIEVHELNMAINDRRFARAMAERLDALVNVDPQMNRCQTVAETNE
jgi:uncharacterized protein (UPF0261 family)